MQLSLFLGNKHGEPLQQLSLAVPPSPGFALALGQVPQQLEPKKQVWWGGRVCVCVVGVRRGWGACRNLGCRRVGGGGAGDLGPCGSVAGASRQCVAVGGWLGVAGRVESRKAALLAWNCLC